MIDMNPYDLPLKNRPMRTFLKSWRIRFLLLAIGLFLAAFVVSIGCFLLSAHWNKLEQETIEEIKAGGGHVSETKEEFVDAGVFWTRIRKLMVRYGIRRLRTGKLIDIGSRHRSETDAIIEKTSNIELVYSINASRSDLTDRSMTTIKHHHAIRHLTLTNTQITDMALADMARLTHLLSLQLDDTAITDKGMKHLAGLTQLRSLNLNGTAVGDAGIDCIPDGIAILKLSETLITDAGVERLTRMRSLQFLDLSNTRITDRAVESLSSCRLLYNLNVENNKLTDAAIDSLAKYKNLGAVVLPSSGISREAKERLRQLRPQRHIQWSP